MSAAESDKSGIDLRWIDKSIRPQDDLFGHVNGKWLSDYEIPADRSQDGAFRNLVDQAEEDVRVIIQEASDLSGVDAQQVADLYMSFMDIERINSLGLLPLQPTLDEIDSVSDKSQLTGLLGKLQREGYIAYFGAYVDTDSKDSSRYLVHFSQAGLGLPDESYYKDESYAEIRSAYVAHLSKMAALAGLSNPDELAASVMDLETKLADLSWDRVSNRDAEKTYHLKTFTDVQAETPGFEWSVWAQALGAPLSAFKEVVVRQPSFLEGATKLWKELPLEQWKAWLAIHTVSAAAAYLSDDFVNENFDFYGKTLSGTPELRERWKRGVSLVQGVLGEALGKIYVERHFPPASKDRMEQLVANLVEAYRQSINSLDWMGPETRERALVKLGKFNSKIGYPDKWKDYSTLEIKPDDLLGNTRRAGEWSTDYELNKLNGPVDKDEWFMTPQTVNAYYHPQLNEIVFPAAILQAPFFDPEADDAANYGGIGGVIGHEIGHGFDDQGSRFDGDGNMVDWWDETDRAEFEKRAQALIEEYNELSPIGLPDHKVNGALTIGENIGDLGGLTIALKAYEISLDGKEAPVIDGLTGVQRVMFGWAQVWRAKTRDEEALRRLATDPHSPPDLRCNGIVTNLDAFYEAFDVSKDDALYTPEEDRVRIW